MGRLFLEQISDVSVTDSCWLISYLLICIPNRICSQMWGRGGSHPSHTLSLSPHIRLPCLPTSLSPSLTHTEIPVSPPLKIPSPPPPPAPPTLSFVFSLPLIAKLAPTQWAGQERMSKWKRRRRREEQRVGGWCGAVLLPNVPVMRILSEQG